MDTHADWDEASGLIYNPEHRSWKDKPQEVMFAHGGFVPSATAFSAKAYGKKVHVYAFANVSEQDALLKYVHVYVAQWTFCGASFLIKSLPG